MVHDGLEPGLAEDTDSAGVVAEAVGAQADLLGGFLAGDVQRRHAGLLEARRALQQQGRFADPGLAPHQDDGARHDPAAEHEVEFGEARAPPRRRRATDVGQSHGRTGRR